MPHPTDTEATRRSIPCGARVTRWSAADGWAIRRFNWPAERARGAILFQGGRGDVFEKYLESFAHWHARGWSVSAFDWRGQGGSGRLSRDARVGHARDFAPWIADLAGFWRGWSTGAPGRRIAIGHSMGGFLLLRALVERAIDPAALVLVAPMLGLRSPLGARAGGWLARALASVGDPARAAWKGNERPAARASRQSILTADVARYADEEWWYERAPELRLGPPSWAWLAEAFAATARLRADPRLEAVRTPTLMLVPEHDALVDPRAAFDVAARLPDAKVIRFGAESAHEILREADPVRDRALEAIDAFLDAHAAA